MQHRVDICKKLCNVEAFPVVVRKTDEFGATIRAHLALPVTVASAKRYSRVAEGFSTN
jgi:hypothetical protein